MSLYRRARRLVRKLQARLPYVPSEPMNVTLERAGRAWLKAMRPYQSDTGIVVLPDYPTLSADHLANCLVLPHRNDILARMPKGSICAEIGVQAGNFSRTILDICRPAELRLVDSDMGSHGISRRFEAEIGSGIVKLHEGDSADTLTTFEDGRFDFIYIDADHSYRGVARDIAAAHRKVRPEGLLIFNDYTFWSSAECMPYGVMHAVNEFCLAEDWEFVFMTLNSLGYFDVALRRR